MSWYNPDWSSRKKITIDNTIGGELSNYQIQINLNYDPDMNPNFSDIRFTDSNGINLLNHYCEDCIDSTSAIFWVKIPIITASTNYDIYVYYGNSGALSTSSGSDTFVIFDDFSSDTIQTNWIPVTVEQGDGDLPTISGGKLNCSIGSASWASTSAVYSIVNELMGDFDAQVDLVSFTADNGDYSAAEFYARNALGDSIYIRMDKDSVGQRSYSSNAWIDGVADGYVYSYTSDTSGKFRIVRSGSTVTVYYWDGVSSWTQLKQVTGFTTNPMRCHLRSHSWSERPDNVSAVWDNFVVSGDDAHSDNFNDNDLDDNKWFKNITGQGVAAIESGGQLNTNAGASITQGSVTNRISSVNGDFEAIMEFSDFVAPASGTSYCRMYFWVDYQNNAFVGLKRNATNTYYASYISIDAVTTTNTSVTSDTSGKVKITRVGSTITLYYWNGSTWSELDNSVSFTEDNAEIDVGIMSWDSFPDNISASINNVMVRKYSNSEPLSIIINSEEKIGDDEDEEDELVMYIYPNQTRHIDPFSNYNSNTVNSLTKMITRGTDCLHSSHALDIISDSTSPTDNIIITTGEFFKDDVLISVDENFTVDMTDTSFYISGPAFNEAGYYWILANYVYAKTIPAPKMSIVILKPTQTSLFNESEHLFLKAVKVSYDGSFYIDSFSNYDPNDLTGYGKRVYSQIYPGLENSIPTSFNQLNDEGRLVYVDDKKSLYFGTNNRFEMVDSVRDIVDTTNCEIGDLAYINSNGKCYPANASNQSTFAQANVISVGLESNGTGKIKLSGRIDNVPVESGISFNINDDVYLSTSENGKATNIKPLEISKVQFLGKSISDSTSEISMWLFPDLQKNRVYEDIEEIGYYSGIDDAISQISSDTKTLLINGEVTLTHNVIIPENISLLFTRSGIFNLGNYNLTINGSLDSDLHQIFNYDGTVGVSFGVNSVQEVFPQWFGAIGDGITDDLEAFDQAITSIGTSNVKKITIPYTGNGYLLSDQWEITRGDIWIDIWDDATCSSTSETHFFYIHGSSGAGNHIENVKVTGHKIMLSGNGSKVIGYSYPGGAYDTMRIAYADNVFVQGIHFRDGLHNCLSLDHCHNYNIDDCEFSLSQHENGFTSGYEYIGFYPYDLDLCANATISNCWAHDNADVGFTTICSTHVNFINCDSWNNAQGFTAELISGTRETYASFKGCRAINNIGRGIWVTVEDCRIEDCLIIGDGSYNIGDTSYITKCGIYQWAAKRLTIRNCEIFNFTQFGVRSVGTSATTTTVFDIENCQIHDCEMGGINAWGVDHGNINNCQIHDCDRGISLYNAAPGYNTDNGIGYINNCQVYDVGQYGIYVSNLDKSIIVDNILRDCPNSSSDTKSVRINDIANCYLFDNIVEISDSTNVDWGIYVTGVGNLYQNNNFISSDVNSGQFYQDGTISIQENDLTYTRSNSLNWQNRLTNLYNGASTGYGNGLQFKLSTPSETNKWAGIAGVAESNYADGVGLRFYTANSGAPTSKMSIEGNGTVDIPIWKLGDIELVSNYSSFSAAVSAIGSDDKTLVVDAPINVATSSSQTVPANIHLVITQAGLLTLSGYNLTINGNFTAPLKQVFNLTGGGVVSFGNIIGYPTIKEIYSEWWGAIADASTDCTTAIQSAINCAGSTIGLPIKFLKGVYMVDTLSLKSNVILEGSGKDSIIKQNVYNGNLIEFNSVNVELTTIKNIKFDGNRDNQITANSCIYYENSGGSFTDDNDNNFHTIENVSIDGFIGNGIYLDSGVKKFNGIDIRANNCAMVGTYANFILVCSQSMFRNCFSEDSNHSGFIINSSYSKFTDCEANHSDNNGFEFGALGVNNNLINCSALLNLDCGFFIEGDDIFINGDAIANIENGFYIKGKNITLTGSSVGNGDSGLYIYNDIDNYFNIDVNLNIKNNSIDELSSLNLATPNRIVINGSEIGRQFSAAPPVGTWIIGDKAFNTNISTGNTMGWVCSNYGTFSTATDSTGDTDGSTGQITGMSNTSDFFAGQWVTISGGFPAIRYKILRIVDSSTILVNGNSTSSVSNVTVATVNPTFVTMANFT